MKLLLICEHQTQIYPPTEVSSCFSIDHDMNKIAPYEVQVIQNKNTNWWVAVWELKPKQLLVSVVCISSPPPKFFFNWKGKEMFFI